MLILPSEKENGEFRSSKRKISVIILNQVGLYLYLRAEVAKVGVFSGRDMWSSSVAPLFAVGKATLNPTKGFAFQTQVSLIRLHYIILPCALSSRALIGNLSF